MQAWESPAEAGLIHGILLLIEVLDCVRCFFLGELIRFARQLFLYGSRAHVHGLLIRFRLGKSVGIVVCLQVVYGSN